MCSTLVYFGLAVVHPFISSTTGEVTCSPTQAMAVYIVYSAYAAFSTLGEMAIIAGMRAVLKSGAGLGAPSCNRYLQAKWFQGQLASLVSFIHFGFIASNIVCLYTGGEDVRGAEGELDLGVHKVLSKMDDSKKDRAVAVPKVPARAVIATISFVLGLVAVPLLFASHIRRVRYIWQYLKPQPEVHRLLPNTSRNSQLAWLCNF